MQLIGTPRSHFVRKVRLLLDHLSLDYELVPIGGVTEADPAAYHGNPMMSVPMLVAMDGRQVFDSDHIAAYIVRRHDPEDRFGVLTDDPALLNARAVMNGIMDAEVKLILSRRTGLDPEPHAYFQKALAVLEAGFAWLEAEADLFSAVTPTYAEFHFKSMWDHVDLYGPEIPASPRLARLSAALGEIPLIAQSAPPDMQAR